MSEKENAVKRSVSIRRDLDGAILEIVGGRQYSAFVNEALALALQTRGVRASIAAFEREHGELTAAEKFDARQRRARAKSE